MTIAALLRSIVAALDAAGVPFMLTGPLAAAYEGCPIWVTSVEDLIVAKLEWAKLGASARQLEDVAALLRVHAGVLDREYLDRWIADLGLAAQWDHVARGGRA